jgi:tetratricopeptide (TPR) repeat protein
MEQRLGDHDAAEATYRRAMDAYRGSVGEDHPLVGQCLYEIGLLHRARSDLHAARRALERSVGLWERLRHDHPELPGILVELGEGGLELGEQDRAAAVLQRALDIARTQDIKASTRARVLFSLARAVESVDPARSMALAAEAADIYADAGLEEKSAEVQSWLAERAV